MLRLILMSFILQKFIVENEKQSYVLNERNLLRDLDSDFIIKLVHTGSDAKFVFIFVFNVLLNRILSIQF